jgi:hypothetical protein
LKKQIAGGFIGSWFTLSIAPPVIDEILKIVIAGGVSIAVQLIVRLLDGKFSKKQKKF